MKKKIILTLLPLIALVGCNKGETEREIKLTVAAPTGAPAVALYTRLFSEKTEINLASNVQTWLSTGAYDVVIAPTNAGAALIKKGAPYKLAATLTFGNFYIASTGHDTDGVMDKDDYVVAFQQNGIPDKLFQYVYGNDYNVHYVSDNTDSVRALTSGKNESDNNADVDYVLVAQPGLHNVMKNKQNVTIYQSLQEEYHKKSNGELTQASVFINNNVEKAHADEFLKYLKEDVNNLLNKPEKMVDKYLSSYSDLQVSAKLGVNQTLLKEVLPDNLLGLGYKEAYSNKSNIDSFLVNLGLGNETSEEIYYK